MYRIIALDMDGTLLNDKKQITPGNLRAIGEASSKGALVVLASARPYNRIAGYVDELGTGPVPVIAGGGADIREHPSGEVLYRAPLGASDVVLIAEFCRRHEQTALAFRFDGSYYYEKRTPVLKAYEALADYPGLCANFEEAGWDDCFKLMIVMRDEHIDWFTDAAMKEFSGRFLVAKSWYNCLEFHSLKGGKGAALDFLLERLNIDRSEAIAVGDDTIDMGMLQAAGLGVAMANSSQALLDAADYIAPSNEDDGVAEVIDRFILNP